MHIDALPEVGTSVSANANSLKRVFMVKIQIRGRFQSDSLLDYQ